MSAAGAVVDASRVIDNMRAAPAEGPAPPDFAVEILRNESGVSIIGLIPANADREALAREMGRLAEGQEVTDLLQVADYPVPEGWDAALAFAVDALEDLPHAKVSVAAGRVGIEALAESEAAQARLEAELARAAPEGVDLALAVSAPRPVIAPFALRFRIEGGAARFDACSADEEAARDAILAAARAAGAEGPIDCRLGLGAPSPEWGAAVAQGIAALHELGGGTLTVADADMALVAAPGTDRALFERVAGELGGALPAVFSLAAERPEPPAEAPEGTPTFAAVLAEGGAVRLTGRVAGGLMGEAARSYAVARFGAEQVTMATRAAPEGLPEGWSVRVLAGLDALARLSDGRVTVTPDLVRVTGRAGDRAAGDEATAAILATLGPSAAVEVEVAYDPSLDPVAGLPSAEECLARITAVTADAQITFDPGSATISREGEPVIESIAEILRACADLRLRIAGYTDSQGREESNLALSQARAEAVLTALRAERVPVAGFEAVGFGEADPIASNETEAGRVANRRIEFSLIGAAPEAGTAVGEEAAGEALPPLPGVGTGGPAEPTISPEARPRAAEGGAASAEEAEEP